VVMVFHGQRTTAQAARQAVERLDSIGATLLGVILNGVDIRNPDYADYRSYYPTYYASMQAESQTTKNGNNGSNFSNGEQDDIISNVADLDRLMTNLGFNRSTAAESSRENGGARSANGVVPREFFDRMAAKLSEALGSGAFAAIANHVKSLGESVDAFPVSRVRELAQLVSQEILDEALRARFLHAISDEIRNAIPAKSANAEASRIQEI
jgi:hypothetical protein